MPKEKDRMIELLKHIEKNAEKYKKIRKERSLVLEQTMNKLHKWLQPAEEENLLVRQSAQKQAALREDAKICFAWKDPENYILSLHGTYAQDINSPVECQIKVKYRWSEAAYQYMNKTWQLYWNTRKQPGEFNKEQFLALLCDMINRFSDA